MDEFDTDDDIITLEDYVKQENLCQSVSYKLKSITTDKVSTNNNKLPMNYAASTSNIISGVTKRFDNSNLISENHSQQPDDLKSLLSKWKLDDIFECFQSERIDINILKIMKPHHVERLLQKFPLGTQILFEHCLEEWKSEINRVPNGNFTHSNLVATSSNLQSSKQNSPASSIRLSPYPRPRRESPQSAHASPTDVTLLTILNSSVKGDMLNQFYEKVGKLHDEQRNVLINIICQYFDEKNIHMSLGTSYRLEIEICKKFPTEKLEFYRCTKRGKLYNRCCNMKNIFKRTVTTITKPLPEKNPTTEELTSEVDAQYSERSLKLDNLTSEEFDRNWEACSHHRLIEMRQIKSIAVILNKWPYYKKAFGYRLIDMDFGVLFKNNSNIVNKWNQYVSQISEFLSKDWHIKDKTIKASLNELKSDKRVSENGHNATLLWALHGYLIPTQKTVTKEKSGKRTIKKYTIRDSQTAFIFVASSVQELDDHIKLLASKDSSPCIMAIGENILRINKIYVFFHGTKFLLPNFIKAVDICFKIFHLFKIEYPLAATNFYSFLEKCFYEIKSAKSGKFTKISVLLNEISPNSLN